MSRYSDNFDRFGNLLEDHSPWTLGDLIVAALAIGFVAAIVSGVFVA